MLIRPRAEPRRGSPQTSLQVQVNLCLRTLSGLASAKIRMQQNLMRQEHRLVVCSWDPARRPQQFELRKRTGQHGRPIESQLTKGSGILAQRGCGGAGKRDASDDEDSQGGRPGNRVLRCTDREIDSFPNGTVGQGRARDCQRSESSERTAYVRVDWGANRKGHSRVRSRVNGLREWWCAAGRALQSRRDLDRSRFAAI